MAKGTLLSQILLKFEKNPSVRGELSAVVQTPDGYLWIGSDELLTIDRLSPTAPNELGDYELSEYEYGEHQQYAVGDYVALPDSQSEIDIEGMDFDAGYLWLMGSHSTRRKGVKGKNAEKDIQRLLDIAVDANRYVLARIPLVDGVPVKQDEASDRTAACLQKSTGKSAGNDLTDVLMADEHIGPFLKMGLPSKDNGLDIEAIAARGNRLFLGLRGPVLRGIAIILEIEVKATKAGTLKLKKLASGKRYRKHFVDLNGLGIRDLCFQGEDLLILAGPTMSLNGQAQLFKLKAPLTYQKDTLFTQSSEALTLVFSLAQQTDENAEGITLFSAGVESSHPESPNPVELMVVYDSPMKARLKGKGSIFSDVFKLSSSD